MSPPCDAVATTAATATNQSSTTGLAAGVQEVPDVLEVRQLFTNTYTYPQPSQDRADVTSLRLLQVAELQAWISDNKLPPQKSKRKEGVFFFFFHFCSHPLPHTNVDHHTDLIAFILTTSEFTQVCKADITAIVEKVVLTFPFFSPL